MPHTKNKVGVMTIAYNGYGRFLKRWAEFVKKSKPDEITILLAGEENLDGDFEGISILREKEISTMGRMRNIAIEKMQSDIILYFSADDILLPNAIKEIRNAGDADIICLKYFEKNGEKITKLETPIPEIEKIKDWQNNYCNSGYVAFKKLFWEKNKYIDSEWPNFPFLFNALKAGAKFKKTKNECAIYEKWKGSHSGRRTEEDFAKAIQTINEYAK